MACRLQGFNKRGLGAIRNIAVLPGNIYATPLPKAPLAGSVLHESALPLFLWRRSTMANSFIGVIRLLRMMYTCFLNHLRAARRAAATASAAAARVAAPVPRACSAATLASSVRMVKATMSGEGTEDVS